MNYWIFVTTDQPRHGLKASDIYSTRMEDRFWGLKETTPLRKSLEAGDQVVFYAGAPLKAFLGTATLASSSIQLEDRSLYSHNKEFFSTEFGVSLENIVRFEYPKLTELIVPNLNFIENKLSWGVYFQGSIIRVTLEDYNTIIDGVLPAQTSEFTEVTRSAQFALENHLEDFIFSNWNSIDFSAKLRLYTTDEQNGRQFPANTWRIDFLCVDEETQEFVVVELKRGRTSDAVVGQVLRYMTWVSENLSGRVRGVIIAQDVDESLRYAVKATSDISILTYRINFALSPFKS